MSKIAEGVKPTLAELEKFEDQPDNMTVERMLGISTYFKFPANSSFIFLPAYLKFSAGLSLVLFTLFCSFLSTFF